LAQFTTAHIFCFQVLKYNTIGKLQDIVQTFSEGMMAVAVIRCEFESEFLTNAYELVFVLICSDLYIIEKQR
jgi:hypothetical protein